MSKEKSNKSYKIIGIAVLILLVVGGFFALRYYNGYFKANVTNDQEYLYIHTGDSFEDVANTVATLHIVKDTTTFRWAAEQMDYPKRIKPGRYKLEPGMNNRTLINKLGGGFQDPVKLRFENIRLKERFAGHLANHLEPDSLTFINLFNDPEFVETYGFNTDNFFGMFIPNTYEFYWNTSAQGFIDRMKNEYDKFWNAERRGKAEALNLTPQEVSALAAIVKGEAMHVNEMPKIAGLYINRLHKGIKLQADPTVIFANNDFTIRRVLFRHLTHPSPYNTYVHGGLPPGPIMMPSIASIDAVLNHENHNYIYMCAKDDFSGYHNFAVTQAEHNINARKFQQALNERNIRQ